MLTTRAMTSRKAEREALVFVLPVAGRSVDAGFQANASGNAIWSQPCKPHTPGTGVVLS